MSRVWVWEGVFFHSSKQIIVVQLVAKGIMVDSMYVIRYIERLSKKAEIWNFEMSLSSNGIHYLLPSWHGCCSRWKGNDNNVERSQHFPRKNDNTTRIPTDGSEFSTPPHEKITNGLRWTSRTRRMILRQIVGLCVSNFDVNHTSSYSQVYQNASQNEERAWISCATKSIPRRHIMKKKS